MVLLSPHYDQAQRNAAYLRVQYFSWVRALSGQWFDIVGQFVK